MEQEKIKFFNIQSFVFSNSSEIARRHKRKKLFIWD